METVHENISEKTTLEDVSGEYVITDTINKIIGFSHDTKDGVTGPNLSEEVFRKRLN